MKRLEVEIWVTDGGGTGLPGCHSVEFLVVTYGLCYLETHELVKGAGE